MKVWPSFIKCGMDEVSAFFNVLINDQKFLLYLLYSRTLRRNFCSFRNCCCFNMAFSGFGYDFYTMNASSLDLIASAQVLLNQERSFDLIDLVLLGIYNRIPSKIILETISAAESMFLSKKLNFQLNL